MSPKELNDILIQAVPNSWAQQAYLQGWDFGGINYKDTCNMFERMEIAKAICEGLAPSKNTQQAESDRASFGRKKNGGGASSPSKPEKGYAGKHKRNNVGHPRDAPTGAKKICMLHGPGHSSKEYKVLH